MVTIGDDDSSSIKYFPDKNDVPNIVYSILNDGEEVIVIAESDISGLKYGKEYLVLTNKRIIVTNTSKIISSFNLNEIEMVEVNRYLGSLVLKAKTYSGSRSLISYTRSRAKDFEKVIMLINDLTLNKIPYDFVKKHLKRRVEEELVKKNNKRKILVRMMSFAKPFWHLMFITLFITMISTVLSLTPPYLMKIMIDQVLVPQNDLTITERLNLLIYIVLGLLGINLALTILNVVNGYMSLKLNQSLTYRIRKILFEKLQRLSLAFYD
ncbi:MAG: hypothetical protein DRJ45_02860, partial [Thermoprotei archaeon]